MGGLDQRRRVADGARGARVAQQQPEELPLGQAARQVVDDEFDAQRLGPGAQHLEGLRERVGVHDEPRRPRLARPAQQRHGLGGRRRLVQQRRACHRQPGEVGDDGLERQQRLQPPLADLGLVGRVCGVPRRVLQHVAADHRRGDGAGVAQADHRDGHGVARCERPQLGEHLGLGGRWRQGRRDRVVIANGVRARQRRPSSSSEAAPMAASMVSSSAGRGPMCRSANGVPRSRSESVGRSVTGRSVAGRSVTVSSGGRRGGFRSASRARSALPLCPRPATGRLRDSPRRAGAFPVGGRARPSLSRGVSPVRSWCLRGSGEELLLRRPAGRQGLSRAGSATTCAMLLRDRAPARDA